MRRIRIHAWIKERIELLEECKDSLEKEAKGVSERIKELQKEQ